MQYGKDVYSSSVVSSIISNIFDNDLTSLKELLKYCVQDIKYKNNISKLRDIYDKNNNDKQGKQVDFCYGIQFYVLNRLTYYVYHDLVRISMKKNDSLLLFPTLKKLFSFFYNFAVYCHCYLHFLKNNEGNKSECLLFEFLFCFGFKVVWNTNQTKHVTLYIFSVLYERILWIKKYII